jgi:hypothetical protein
LDLSSKLTFPILVKNKKGIRDLIKLKYVFLELNKARGRDWTEFRRFQTTSILTLFEKKTKEEFVDLWERRLHSRVQKHYKALA